MRTKSMLFVVVPGAFPSSSIYVRDFSFSMSLIIYPCSLVHVSVWVSASPLAMSQALIRKVTNIFLIAWEFFCEYTVRSPLIIHPFSFILIPI